VRSLAGWLRGNGRQAEVAPRGRFPFRVGVPASQRGWAPMSRGFLHGLFLLPLLLRPPLLQSGRRMLGPESVPAPKRLRSDLMARPQIGTHNGTFHCDEALACALLRLLPEYRVRSAKLPLGMPAPLTGSLWEPAHLPARARSPGNPTLILPARLLPGSPFTSCVSCRMQRLCALGTPKNSRPVTSWWTWVASTTLRDTDMTITKGEFPNISLAY
jgi:hypothetical protein